MRSVFGFALILAEVIVAGGAHCAPVFSAFGGYGAKRHLHYPRKLGASDEGPLMILFIDDEERVKSILPHLKEIVAEGLVAYRKVELA